MIAGQSRPRRKREVVSAQRLAEHLDKRDEIAALGGRVYDEVSVYLRPIRHWSILPASSAKWRQLFSEYKAGSQQARDELVYRNMRLVVSIGLRYTNRGLALLDLCQEGAIALMTAIDQYDIEKGFQFSTYATWWIRQGMSRALQLMNERRAYYIPVHVQEKLGLVDWAIKQIWNSEGDMPNNFQILKKAREKNTKASAELTLLEVKECVYILITGNHYSLDYEEAYDSYGKAKTPLRDRLSDPKATASTVLEAKELLPKYAAAIDRITNTVSKLPPREAMILRLRFGLGEFEAMTLEEIGQRYEVTRERIRQLEDQGLERLTAAGVKIDAAQIEKILNVHDELQRIIESV